MNSRRIKVVASLPSDAITINEYMTKRMKYEFDLYYSKSEDMFYQKVPTGYTVRFPSDKHIINVKLKNNKYGCFNVNHLKSYIEENDQK